MILRAAVLLAVASLVAAGCGGRGKDTRSTDEIVESIAEQAPAAGLGESAPPNLRVGWDTDFDKRSVDFEEIRAGGPGKDGIPAIDRPVFQTALDVDWLADREPVIALTVAGLTRGYPLQIMTWHEIVNDVVQGRPVAITFCPLCNTAIVFDRRVEGRVLSFGTTGNLRHSDLVMYDRQTESWWQQFSGEAIVGAYTGAELEQIPARIVSWHEFRMTFPESEVLSRDTGHSRDYGRNPYTGYDDVDSPPIFATGVDDGRLPPKERVVFVEVEGVAVAVPFTALAERGTVETAIGGKTLRVRWRRGVASALDSGKIAEGRDVGAATVELDGEPVPFSEPFWFAVAAFRGDVRVIR